MASGTGLWYYSRDICNRKRKEDRKREERRRGEEEVGKIKREKTRDLRNDRKGKGRGSRKGEREE